MARPRRLVLDQEMSCVRMRTHTTLRSYILSAIARFPDDRMMIRDGHHRCLATYIGGRTYLRHDEYSVETYTYEMYAEINFEAGFVTPFDPHTEVRVPDFTAFRQEVFRLYARNPEGSRSVYSTKQVALCASAHAQQRSCNSLSICGTDAIAEGIARGDLVADMVILGVSTHDDKAFGRIKWHIAIRCNSWSSAPKKSCCTLMDWAKRDTGKSPGHCSAITSLRR